MPVGPCSVIYSQLARRDRSCIKSKCMVFSQRHTQVSCGQVEKQRKEFEELAGEMEKLKELKAGLDGKLV